MYRGLMVDFLNRAVWKKSSYQGKALLPGQFGAVMSHLAESLGVPRSTLQRMVAHLEADDFLKVENVGNRFVVITIANWHIYQESEKEAWATGGQPAVNQRATGGQPSYKVEEVKKEEEKNISTSPRAGVDDPLPGKGEAAKLFKTVKKIFEDAWPEAQKTVVHTDAMLFALMEHMALDRDRAGPDFWLSLAQRSRSSAFLRGEVAGAKGFFPGMKLSWFVKLDSVGKILNGDFDDAPARRARASPSAAASDVCRQNTDAIEAALAARRQRRRENQ